MTSRTEYCTQTPNKPSLFDVQYLRKNGTLDIGVLGYIGTVWPKEHSPEVRSLSPGTPCIFHVEWTCSFFSLTTLNSVPLLWQPPSWSGLFYLRLYFPLFFFIFLLNFSISLLNSHRASSCFYSRVPFNFLFLYSTYFTYSKPDLYSTSALSPFLIYCYSVLVCCGIFTSSVAFFFILFSFTDMAPKSLLPELLL